jgi:DNA-binding NarL/FixJ family response regulator
MPMAMNVLIVDDHPLYRDGMKALLFGLDPAVQVIGVASVADAALATAGGPRIDLVLLDMKLPGGVRGLQALEHIKVLFTDATVVVVSGEEDPELVLRTIDAGASGYIPKTTDNAVTVQALRLVLAQGVYLPPLAMRHARLSGTPSIAESAASAMAPDLSKKQLAVLQLLLQGKANKIIARELDVAEGTVKAHLWAVYQALGVSTRSQAMCKAYEMGLLGKL